MTGILIGRESPVDEAKKDVLKRALKCLLGLNKDSNECLPVVPASSCDPFTPDKKNPAETNVPIVIAVDPNDKLGPSGAGQPRYIAANNPLSYLVRFENQATASAPAQFVKIIDTLDRDKLDFASFQFAHFSVADTTFYVSPGRKHFLRDWDLRPVQNLILRMEATFNDLTGVLLATYTALNPQTMELTQDPIAGFLPPNQNAPEGEGSIFFSINPKPNLPHGSTISNKALIYFDYNAPILTPLWINTLDTSLPSSQVLPLPPVTADTTFTLRWNGHDTGAGTRLFDIYKSVNHQPYQPLVLNTSLTELNFTGKIDSTYRFYSIAIDSVGNQEPSPTTFDAETTIRLRVAPDLTPLVYVRPTAVYGSADMTMVVDVVEINGTATAGMLIVKITRDRKANLSFSPTATRVNNRSVENSSWSFDDSDPNYYVLTTTTPVPAGNKLSFGLTGTLTPGATTGVMTGSAVVLGYAVGEERATNNIDADKMEYFQQ